MMVFHDGSERQLLNDISTLIHYQPESGETRYLDGIKRLVDHSFPSNNIRGVLTWANQARRPLPWSR